MTEFKIDSMTWEINSDEPSPYDEPANPDQLSDVEQIQAASDAQDDEFRWQEMVEYDLREALSNYLSYASISDLLAIITELA